MHNITQDTLKMKRFDRKTDANLVAHEMNKYQPASRPWVVSRPNSLGKRAVMSLNAEGFLIYVSV